MSKIIRIDHVAIVVEDIDIALRFWRDALGLDLSHVEDVPDQESVVAFLPTGDSEVELVKPTTDDSGVARYLEKRGPGIHHICFEVEDITATLESLKMKGIRLINDQPIIGTGGKQIAFVHPEGTHGVLVELYQLHPDEQEIRVRRAQSLADRVLARGQIAAAATLGFLRALRDNGRDGRGEEREKTPASTP